MAGPNTLSFDDANFEDEVLGSESPVLVDFWAEWCGPCHLLAPTIDELADDYSGKVKIGKVDIDKSPNVAAKFGIQSIPTVIVFHKGEIVERMTGIKQKQVYEQVLNEKAGVA